MSFGSRQPDDRQPVRAAQRALHRSALARLAALCLTLVWCLVPAPFAASTSRTLCAQTESSNPPPPAAPPAANPSSPNTSEPANDGDPQAEVPTNEDLEQEPAPLPLLDALELPSAARLLRGPAIDWIVLKTNHVIEAEPVYPRPGTLEAMNRRIKDSLRRAGQPRETDEEKQKRLALNYLPVTVLDGDTREFKLHLRFIKEIIHYDDLMLRRIDQLLDSKQPRKAWELLVALENRSPGWPGSRARQERLLFVEAGLKADAQLLEQALVLLEELHDRNKEYPGLDARFGTIADSLIATALQSADYRRARYFLARLRARFPNQPVVRARTAELQNLAAQLIQTALAAEQSGQPALAFERIDHAARVWPDHLELPSLHRRLAHRFQRLNVGVYTLPHPAGTASVGPTATERRLQSLTQLRLFEPARVRDKVIRYETPWLTDWTPAELGHTIQFKLGARRPAWQSQPRLTAGDIAARLTERMNASPQRDARLGSSIESVTVHSPLELTIRFRQVPLRPEALFAFPLTDPPAQMTDSAHLAQAALEPTADATPAIASAITQTDATPAVTAPASAPMPGTVLTYPFHIVPNPQPQRGPANADNQTSQAPQHPIEPRLVLRRSVPEDTRLEDRHVDEVVEIAYPTQEAALRGLLRGEVSLLPSVAPRYVQRLEQLPEFFVQPYAIPVTHLLQFNPQNSALANRTLRRALVYALPRERVLHNVFLQGVAGDPQNGRDPRERFGRLTSAPFPSTSYATNKAVAPHNFDPVLAFSLLAAARKELGGNLPPLTLHCPSELGIPEAAAQLAEAWTRLGLEVTVQIDTPEKNSAAASAAHWDIAYRTVQMSEPLVELWPLLTLNDATDVASLAHLPAWLRQELLALDQVGDWTAAESLLKKLHHHLWAEVHLIPLWEIDEFMVARRHIRGIPSQPITPYQGLERWKVESWYAHD